MAALFDFLKKKEEKSAATKAKADKEKIKKPEKKAGEVKVEKKAEKATAPVKSSKKVSEFAFEAVREPHISEKASYLAEKDQYTFKVSPNYNKNEIKKAVEGLYGVDVLSVSIIKIPAKKRRLGRTEGFKKAYTKAVVKIKNGQKIEIL